MRRLADRILSGEPILTFSLSGEVRPMANQVAKALRGQPRVIADEVSEWYWTSPQQDWDYQDSFGPLRPPFDAMWIEARAPRKRQIDGAWVDRGCLESNGFAITCLPADPEAAMGASVVAMVVSFVAADKSAPIVALPWVHSFALDALGQYISHHIMAPEEYGRGALGDYAYHVEPHVAMLALSLMHCKNVRLDAQVPERARIHAARKRGHVLTSYDVIRLPDGRSTSVRTQQSKDAVGITAPLHLVRGHFKTYNTEAPLFGKHTGTYWWGWQARGEEHHGVNIHDYRVDPARRPN